jgi:cell division protein FtsB
VLLILFIFLCHFYFIFGLCLTVRKSLEEKEALLSEMEKLMEEDDSESGYKKFVEENNILKNEVLLLRKKDKEKNDLMSSMEVQWKKVW